ncbi:DUF1990 family protein [Subtercola boreus]|uniref:DUF1990 domain-containing protein n=1 Tax=Subtercola boreus TaxID=120213 RepID=A0A3E0WES3_9MICO|nr:DUF1990 domain-containing protein [Subtercola boreus]RFA21809.1 hypothetical protein B7R24_05880 [Subtercola boreus]RFA21920.1 hypothetical protein B7R23_05825 [Subtercola boreus]RFA27868.1 hypothetical protein B7R25_05950 [Subtercola boreus]
MSTDEPRTRATHSGQALTYAAIGASQADDLMYYPPKGFKPFQARARLGSGDDRFASAAESILTWGVQRGSGMAIENIELPVSSDSDYVGLVYDANGVPTGPRQLDEGHVYTEDGTPHVAPGVTAELVVHVLGVRFVAPVRVVSVTTDAHRVGFAYGTLPGHPQIGEESFMVEQHDDGSVWIVIRSFSRPSTWYYRLATPLVRWQQRTATKQYLRALLPARTP